ncbi:MAG: PspC domain-containing protein [Opitutaceae bacterium]|jgi:phage shock protein PspC (stress-responsive transcriptional regulator)
MALTRSRSDKYIAGVCGGLARHLGWSSSRVRVAYFLLTLLSAAFPGILGYLALWFLMPLGD